MKSNHEFKSEATPLHASQKAVRTGERKDSKASYPPAPEGASGKKLAKLAGGLSAEALDEMKAALRETETVNPDAW
jgi:hypothetical protein